MQFTEDEVFAELGRLYMANKKLVAAVQAQAAELASKEDDAASDSA